MQHLKIFSLLGLFFLLFILIQPRMNQSSPDTTETIVFSDYSHHHVSLGNSSFCNVSPYPEETTLEQPNGNQFQARIFTIGHAAYLETVDGYSIIQDANDYVFRYASRGTKGNLFQTGIPVSNIDERAA